MIEDMYATPMLPQTYFLETMEGSFRKRQYRVGKNLNMVGTMQKKAAGASKCHGQNYGATELKEKKGMFCKGYNPCAPARLLALCVFTFVLLLKVHA